MVRWLSEIDSKKVRKNRIYRLDTPLTIGVSLFTDKIDLMWPYVTISKFSVCILNRNSDKKPYMTLDCGTMIVEAVILCTRDSRTRDPGVIYVKKGYIYAYTYP